MDTNYYLKKLYQDMQLRAYSKHTQDVYGMVVRKFLNYSRKPVEMLDEHDVRKYVLFLMQGDLSKNSINTYQAAIRFFFGVTLNRSMNYLQMPRLKKDQTLPEILSREEMARLLERCENPKHCAMFPRLRSMELFDIAPTPIHVVEFLFLRRRIIHYSLYRTRYKLGKQGVAGPTTQKINHLPSADG